MRYGGVKCHRHESWLSGAAHQQISVCGCHRHPVALCMQSSSEVTWLQRRVGVWPLLVMATFACIQMMQAKNECCRQRGNQERIRKQTLCSLCYSLSLQWTAGVALPTPHQHNIGSKGNVNVYISSFINTSNFISFISIYIFWLMFTWCLLKIYQPCIYIADYKNLCICRWMVRYKVIQSYTYCILQSCRVFNSLTLIFSAHHIHILLMKTVMDSTFSE